MEMWDQEKRKLNHSLKKNHLLKHDIIFELEIHYLSFLLQMLLNK